MNPGADATYTVELRDAEHAVERTERLAERGEGLQRASAGAPPAPCSTETSAHEPRR